MAKFQLSIVLLTIAAWATVGTCQRLISPRLIGGVPIDTLRRFPHHVTIGKQRWSEEPSNLCGGSILNDRWILTSARCVDQSSRLYLNFEKLYSNSSAGSYTAVVNNDAVQIYPTYYDDIALVKLPFRLIFSDTIKPVHISSRPLAQLEGQLAVLPGFNADAIGSDNNITLQSQQLTYAMLSVISNDKCKQSVSSDFDEYLQLCTVGWAGNKNTPCVTDFGSGLLSGWPAKSELIGIYSSTSWDCNSSSPAVYTNVAKYTSWIQGVISS